MKIELLLACAFTTSLANVNAVGVDEKVRDMVVYAGKVFDNPDYARRMYTAAFELWATRQIVLLEYSLILRRQIISKLRISPLGF